MNTTPFTVLFVALGIFLLWLGVVGHDSLSIAAGSVLVIAGPGLAWLIRRAEN